MTNMTVKKLGWQQMTDLRMTSLPSCSCIGKPDLIVTTHCESSEHYHNTLLQLDERWRLIVCGAHYQLILQRREGLHGGAWRGFKYFRTKNALLKVCGGLGLLSDTITARIECILPPNFEVVETKRVKT